MANVPRLWFYHGALQKATIEAIRLWSHTHGCVALSIGFISELLYTAFVLFDGTGLSTK